MLDLARHGCPGPTSLVPGFLWGNWPLTLRLPPCPRLTPRYGQYLTHAPSHITREVAILIDPQSPLFLGQIKPSGSGNEKGKWRPWRERAVSPSLRLMSMGPWTRLWSYRGPKAMPSWWALTRSARAVHGYHCSVDNCLGEKLSNYYL